METTTRKRPTVPRLRGLPSTRSGALLLAGVCAVVAAGVIIYAIGQYRKSVNASARQDTVLVSSSTIQKGTSGEVIASRQLAKSTPIVEKHLLAGAVADAALLRGRVALHDILPGQQLRLTDFGPASGYQSQLAPDERAISIPLDASHGLSTVLQAGDHVDLYAGGKVSANGSATGSSTGNGNGTASVSASASAGLRLLLTNVPVLAVNLNAGSGGVGGQGNVGAQADVLFKVKAADAGAVAFASDNESVWLVLRGANAITPKSENGVLFTLDYVLHRNVSDNSPTPTTSTIGAHP